MNEHRCVVYCTIPPHPNTPKQTTQLHKDVLAARYRDVAPEVRTIVVSVIGELCKERPGDFLQDSHLRYIAWALSDEVGKTNKQQHRGGGCMGNTNTKGGEHWKPCIVLAIHVIIVCIID